MAQGRVYGHIPGVSVGTRFDDRRQLLDYGVHTQTQAGIHGDHNPNGGAFSICISGGYEDNVDNGETITYVGSGGQNDNKEQIADQSFENPLNKSLLISSETKRPVRVVRGKSNNSFYAPAKGFRYDGLYVVDSAELRPGKSGYRMCFFKLRRLREEGDRPIPTRRLLDQRKLLTIFKK